jgi:tetratricopeptide (TPR) repeat protein
MIAEEYRKRGVAFRSAGQNDSARAYLTKAVEAWADLIAADPKNVQLVQDIVNKIGQTGYAVAAKPIITKAVDDNPGDPDLIKLKWQILLATRDTADLREAVKIGDDMVKVDTSAADTTFFIRQAAAYAQLGDVQKAAATTSAGINKFPLNQSIWALNAQVQRLAGNPQAALDASQKLVQLDPANGHYYLLMAQAQIDLQRPDPAVQSIRLALKPPGAPRAASAAAKEDSVLAGKLLLVLGNQAYKAAGAANPQRRDDYKRAVSLLSFADSVAPTPQAKFVKGVAAFKAGDMAVRENQTAKRCDLAHEAQDYFTIAQINVAAGGSVDPKTAGQILSILSQYGPSVDGQLKKFCK